MQNTHANVNSTSDLATGNGNDPTPFSQQSVVLTKQAYIELKWQAKYWRAQHAQSLKREAALKAQVAALEATVRDALLLAFCWTHVRRDFLKAARSWLELEHWMCAWVDDIGVLYRTVLLWGLNPHHWFHAFLQACADNGGQSPTDLSAFLPWQRTPERREALARPVSVTCPSLTGPAQQREESETADTS